MISHIIKHNKRNNCITKGKDNTMKIKNLTTLFTTRKIIKNPIGNKNIFFRRTTSRYAQKGTISHNVGYFYVSRCAVTGQFIKRQK